MEQNIESILKLQQLDQEIDLIKSDAQVFPDRLKEVQDEYDQKKLRFDEISTRIKALEAEKADLTDTLSLEEQRLAKSKKKLNEISKSYEYQALKKEIESTERNNTLLETQIKEKESDIEKTSVEMTSAKEEYEKVQERLDAIQGEVTVKMGELDGVLSEKTKEQEHLEGDCDKAILSKYRMIRSRRYADALVPVISGSCQGCFMNVPPQMFNQMLQDQTKIHQCPNCQRLIFWKEDEQE
ncbi:MAG: C4-type zinc ribbon domain-containing protein [Bdellovibrionota bacterium]